MEQETLIPGFHYLKAKVEHSISSSTLEHQDMFLRLFVTSIQLPQNAPDTQKFDSKYEF